MAEKRKQEEANENAFSKRHCVENADSSKDLSGEEGHDEQEVVDGHPASWGSQASSSDSSGSSSSGGNQAGADSSSEGSITDSLDMGLGDIQPDSLAGPMGWLQKQMMSGTNPRSILMRIIPSGMAIPEDMDEFEMWSIIAEYLRSIDEPPPRQKLEQYNTFDDAIQLLRSCKNILVLTGAGVSVSCGIPDFRSRDGVYARLAVDFPDLPDPQAMFEISYFRKDPRPFYKFAKELFPGQFKPSTSHKFISQLEQHQSLLRNYTQNIDTLEQAAGITRIIQCHGSFATATCTRCGLNVDSDAIKEDVFNQVVPICPQCGPDTPEMAVLKPDIVFFGEGLPNHFYDKLNDDKEAADLLIVMGSSLKVRPVATIPSLLPKNVPQILINREPLHHLNFDIELLGDCDVIINEILHRLGDGWNHVCQSQQRLTETYDVPSIHRPRDVIKEEDTAEEKATVDEQESDKDCKMVATSAMSNGESTSSPEKVNVKSEESEKPLALLKEESESNCRESEKESCAERLQQHDDHALSEPCLNGSVDEGKPPVDSTSCSESKTNNSLPSNIDRLSSLDDKAESALVSTEAQTTNKTSDVSQSPAEQDQSVLTESAAEQYMLFQRTLDSMGNSSTASSSIDATDDKDPRRKDDGNEPSPVEKTECIESTMNETDRTKSPDAQEDKPCKSDSSPESTGDYEDQASPATDGEAKPSQSASAAAKPSRETISTHLMESSFLFIPPMRYVFHGAEVYLSDDDDESEHGFEGLASEIDDLHNDIENSDLHDDFHSDLHNGDDLPDLMNGDHPSSKEKGILLDDLTPTVPLTNGESSHYDHPVSKAQYVPDSNDREGSPFEAPSHEAVYTNLDQPVTP